MNNTDRARYIVSQYDAGNDIILQGPKVTWAEMLLLEMIEELQKKVDVLVEERKREVKHERCN